MKWRNVGYNEVLDGDGFFVSYNPDPSSNPMVAIADMFIMGGENRQDETALCVDQGERKYFILSGDHRKEFEKRIGSLQECFDYFVSHREQWTATSDVPDGEKRKLMLLGMEFETTETTGGSEQ